MIWYSCPCRIQFPDPTVALKAMREEGGRYAVAPSLEGPTWWYSIHYTPSEIMTDLPGNLLVLGASDLERTVFTWRRAL